MERYEILKTLLPENAVMAEVGVSSGENASHLLQICSFKKLYLIDPDPGDVFNYGHFAVFNNVKFYKDLSVHAATRFPDKLFDLVFIDAEHSYEAVKNDIAAWLPKVRPGGILCGHDFQPANQPVIDAVIEIFGNKITVERETNGNGIWWIRI